MSEDKIRILIVEARFYSDLADELLKGAIDAIEAYGAEYEVVTVPAPWRSPPPSPSPKRAAIARPARRSTAMWRWAR
jgi:hypothetical protein